MPSGRSISNLEVIALAACPTCCSFRREPCRFSREEDPEGLRHYRKGSHDARVILAKKIAAEEEKALDSISIRL